MEYLDQPEFRQMTPADKLNLMSDLGAGHYDRVHLYRMNEWREEVTTETRGNPEWRLNDEIRAFTDRNPSGAKLRYMQDETQHRPGMKPAQFKRQIIVLEPKRGLIKKLLNPLGF